MADEPKEVKQEVSETSAETKEVVEQSAETTPQETSTQQPEPAKEEIPIIPSPQGQVEAVDEMGVPYKNRMFEWKRKAEELAEKLPSLVEEKIKQAFQQYGGGQQQREYTIAELEAFAIQNPEHRPWVEEQKALLIRKQLAKEMEEKLQLDRKQREAELRRQQSLKYVMDNYPEAFLKNSQGQIVGWNNEHPLTQQIGVIMQDPRLANDPDGLMAAADIGYARYIKSQQTVQQQKEKQLKQEVKNLQKKTLVEGGGKPSEVVSDPVRVAIERLKKTGSMKDAEIAMAEIFKRAKTKTIEE